MQTFGHLPNVNSQAVVQLEMQLGRLGSAIGMRENGTFPSQHITHRKNAKSNHTYSAHVNVICILSLEGKLTTKFSCSINPSHHLLNLIHHLSFR